MFMYCIYRITNKINGKTYIGQHKYKDLSQDKYMGSGKLINQAYSKYGIENFEREILVSDIETRLEIDNLEREYIRLERDSGHGEYNLANGGEGLNLSGKDSPNYGKILIHDHENHHKFILKDCKIPEGYTKGLSEDKIQKQSIIQKGIPRSEEFKKKRSNYMKGMICIHDSNGNEKRIHIGDDIPEGYERGMSKNTRDKMSKPKINKPNLEIFKKKRSEFMKGKRWIHDSEGIESYIPKDSPLPTGYFEGRSVSRGKKLYNNGTECHRYLPGTEPEGYILGKLSE